MHSWYTIEETAAIINARHDQTWYKQFIDGGRRQELPSLSDIMLLIVDYLQVLLICSFLLSLTSNHESRLRTAELTTATVAWRKSRCAIFTLSSYCWEPTTRTTTTSFINISLRIIIVTEGSFSLTVIYMQCNKRRTTNTLQVRKCPASK